MSNNHVNKKEKEESYEQNNAYTQSYEVPNNQLYQSREYYSQNYYQYSYPYNYYRGEGGMTMPKSEYLDETSSEKPKVKGKKKMVLEYIEPKNKRSVTFSKRKKGILKKAYELNVLTGAQVLLLIANDTGHVYTFATPKLRPIISDHEYLIQQCLNTPLIDDYNDFRHNKPLQTYPMDKTYEDFSGKRNEKE
ncbi:Regulator of arginine MADS box-containing [Tubulinosema ratisbonensis]|uniref:Regulator of arginine MADS box-containing n=1 Tax=Tubulinosema ratisbonensis TaxID=291195 RepID=A0A437AM15_9MICR|nr:Regulator of arginine MADS box-containing [Tubulinosema ratisbonensis]